MSRRLMLSVLALVLIGHDAVTRERVRGPRAAAAQVWLLADGLEGSWWSRGESNP